MKKMNMKDYVDYAFLLKLIIYISKYNKIYFVKVAFREACLRTNIKKNRINSRLQKDSEQTPQYITTLYTITVEREQVSI